MPADRAESPRSGSQRAMSSNVQRKSAAPNSLSTSRAMVVAAVIEFALVGASVVFVAQATAKVSRPDLQPVEVVLAEPEPPPPKPEPRPQQKPLPVPVKTVALQAPAPVHTPPAPAKPREEPVPPIAAESPIVESAAPPPPPPVARSATVDREAEFAALVKAAIQAAVTYPPAARSMGFRGRARVEFEFRDGAASLMRIIQTSGIGLIDRAALAAVAGAHYPLPPESLLGKTQIYQVNVLFELNGAR